MTLKSPKEPQRHVPAWAPGVTRDMISEEEFALLLAAASRDLLRMYAFLARTPRSEWAKRHFNRLFQEADELETLLDDHGAGSNRTFHVLRELVAGVRGFSAACHVLKHVDLRLVHYPLECGFDALESFRAGLDATYRFTCDALWSLLSCLAQEAARAGCAAPEEMLADGQFPDEPVQRRLPNDVEEQWDPAPESETIVELASRHLEAARRFERVPPGPIPTEGMQDFLERHFREEEARTLAAMVHNLQSRYDTRLRNTAVERSNPRLPCLRGHSSVALHLMELATLLVHFYQRHEADVMADWSRKERRPDGSSGSGGPESGSESGWAESDGAESGGAGWADTVEGKWTQGRALLRQAVDADVVLDRAINFGLHWAREFLLMVRPVAEDLVAHYGNETSLELPLPEGAILHARPASLIVAIVNHHAKPVELEIDGERANGGSIMQMMILAGKRPDARRVVFRGDAKVLADLKLLFEAGLGEKGLESLPGGLSYLKD